MKNEIVLLKNCWDGGARGSRWPCSPFAVGGQKVWHRVGRKILAFMMIVDCGMTKGAWLN